jgi:MYXO-CTERM domain-containing protein
MGCNGFSSDPEGGTLLQYATNTSRHRPRGSVLAVLSAVAFLSCAPPEADDSASAAVAPAVTVAPVVGGTMSAPCGWPSTVDVNGCTGTLIHHRVVTTAAHCLSGTSAKITFTAGRNQPGAFSLTGTCKAGARGSAGGGTSKDWGYCVIPEDMRVTQLPVTPPLVGCEADRYLKAGTSAWVVGFGTTGPDGTGAGVKRQVEVKVNALRNGVVDIGDKDVGACHGDSGGPLYVQLKDGTHDWGLRVAGSTSSAGSARCDCTCNTIYVNISNHVKAIEANEGIDVTPCTDADGNWAPGPDCHDFQSAPQDGTGTYPACSVTATTGPIDSCSGAIPLGGSGGSSAGGTGGRGGSAAGGRSGGGGSGGVAGTSTAGSAANGGMGGASGGVSGGGGVGIAGASGGLGVGVGVAGSAGALPNTGTIMNPVGVAGVSGAAGAAGALGAPISFTIPAKDTSSGGCSAAPAGRSAPPLWFVLGAVLFGLKRRRARAKRVGS